LNFEYGTTQVGVAPEYNAVGHYRMEIGKVYWCTPCHLFSGYKVPLPWMMMLNTYLCPLLQLRMSGSVSP